MNRYSITPLEIILCMCIIAYSLVLLFRIMDVYTAYTNQPQIHEKASQ